MKSGLLKESSSLYKPLTSSSSLFSADILYVDGKGSDDWEKKFIELSSCYMSCDLSGAICAAGERQWMFSVCQ